MMKNHIFVLLLSLLLPVTTIAEPMPVQTGEHEGFTRLVITAEVGVIWDASQLANTVTITINNGQNQFNLKTVYNRIGRERITKITTNEKSLIVELACLCRVSSYVEARRHIVVDIADDPRFLPKPLLDLESIPDATAEALPRALTYEWNDFQPDAKNTEADLPSVYDFQKRLAENLGRLGTHDLLSLSPEATVSRLNTKKILKTPSINPRDEPILPSKNDNIKPTTLPSKGNNLYLEQPDFSSCKFIEDIEIESWADGPISVGFAEGRKNVTSDTGNVNGPAAIRLVKEYLYYGFGAESLQILSMLDTDGETVQILKAMADIMGFGKPGSNDVFESIILCNPSLALWNILSNRAANKIPKDQVSESLRTFDRLPPHLRKLIAPMLITRFEEMQLNDAALTVYRTLERIPEPAPWDTEISALKAALAQNNEVDLRDILFRLPEFTGDRSSENFILIMNAKNKLGLVHSQSEFTLLDSYIFQETNEFDKAHLLKIKTNWQIQSGDFAGAKETLVKIGTYSKMDSEAVLEHFYEQLTALAEDITFLEYALTIDSGTLKNLKKSVAVSLRSRLHDLQFIIKPAFKDQDQEKAVAEVADQERFFRFGGQNDNGPRSLSANGVKSELIPEALIDDNTLKLSGQESLLLRSKLTLNGSNALRTAITKSLSETEIQSAN